LLFWESQCCLIITQGSWCDNTNTLMDHHLVHIMANGWDAWNGSREKVWQVPWTGSVCIWWKAWSLYCGASTTCGWNWGEHCVHGHWRNIITEVPWYCVFRLQKDQINLFYYDLCLCSLCTIPSPWFQFHYWCILGSCSHVLKVLLSFHSK